MALRHSRYRGHVGGAREVGSYTYDQWGKPLTVSESVPQQIRYAGSWYDNELGWYWLSVRPYDPVLERFTQPDPSQIQGLFSYVYAGDNPSDLGDPSGLSIAIPLQSGTLVTPGPGSFFENNVAVGSDQWNIELGQGTKSAGGLVGANGRTLVPGNGQALVPRICGNIKAICPINMRPSRGPALQPLNERISRMPMLQPLEEGNPPGPGTGAGEGSFELVIEYDNLLASLYGRGLIEEDDYLQLKGDLQGSPGNPEQSARLIAQARFALNVARDLGKPIAYDTRYLGLDASGRQVELAQVDVQTSHVQLEFTAGETLGGKVSQFFRNSQLGKAINPQGKYRVIFDPDLKDRYVRAVQNEYGIRVFKPPFGVLKERASLIRRRGRARTARRSGGAKPSGCPMGTRNASGAEVVSWREANSG